MSPVIAADFRWLLSKGAAGGALRLIGAAAHLASITVAVRLYGSDDAGKLLYLSSTLLFIGAVARLGGEFPLGRLHGETSVATLAGALFEYRCAAVVVAVLAGTVAMSLSPVTIELLTKNIGLQGTVLLLLAAFVGVAWAFSGAAVHQATGRPLTGIFLAFGWPAICLLGSIGLGWSLGWTIDKTALVFLAANGAGVLVGWTGRMVVGWPWTAAWRWVRGNASFGAVQGVQMAIAWVPVFLFGMAEDYDGVTLWNTSVRLSMLVSFGFVVVSQVSLARISGMLESGVEAVAVFLRRACMAGVAMALPPLILLIAFAEPVCNLMGIEGARAVPLLWVLCGFQMLNVFTGLVVQVSLLQGDQRNILLLQVAALVGVTVLGWLAYLVFGLLGYALTWAFFQMVIQIGAAVRTKRRLGTWIVPLPMSQRSIVRTGIASR